MKRKPWTAPELKILREKYARFSVKTMERLLPGRTIGAIRWKADKLGLAKYKHIDPAEWLAQCARESIQTGLSAATIMDVNDKNQILVKIRRRIWARLREEHSASIESMALASGVSTQTIGKGLQLRGCAAR